MKLEPSPSQTAHQRRRPAALIRLTGYALVVCALAAVFYKLLFTKMWLVPLLAECILIRSPWTLGPLGSAAASRAVGLSIGNILAYFLYIVPVVYEGHQPWSEESLWLGLTVAAQIPVATCALLLSRRLFPKRLRPLQRS